MNANPLPAPATSESEPEIFARQGYLIIRGLIDPALAGYFWSYAHTRFASLQLSSGDSLVPNTPAGYGDPAFEGLLEHLRPRVGTACGMRLFPTYSYFRLYKKGDVLKRHSDRPACEISVSLNVGQEPSEPWPLFIEGPAGPAGTLLTPGDALVYRGIEHPHWRDRFEGARLVQVFLHYVDADGPHADQKFDKRPGLMAPRGGGAQDDRAVS